MFVWVRLVIPAMVKTKPSAWREGLPAFEGALSFAGEGKEKSGKKPACEGSTIFFAGGATTALGFTEVAAGFKTVGFKTGAFFWSGTLVGCAITWGQKVNNARP